MAYLFTFGLLGSYCMSYHEAQQAFVKGLANWLWPYRERYEVLMRSYGVCRGLFNFGAHLIVRRRAGDLASSSS